ncbi:MAG: chemotaxis protein CheW [Actinomycetota bacterium]|nr:chemotaxis protein CheW [Actinomycetota bacterium]
MTPRKKTQKTETVMVEADNVVAAAEPEAPEAVAEQLEPVEGLATCDMPEDAAELADTAGAEIAIEQMVAFHLGGQRYALPIGSVQEIQQIVALSEAHGGSDAVIGMINLRGSVIPAIDMRALLGLPHLEYRLDTPMIICRLGTGFVALVVDEVEDVLDVPVGGLSAPPKLHALGDRMIGVCHLDTELVFLLSIEKLIAPLGLDAASGW